jgi:serine/threonine protein kinase
VERPIGQQFGNYTLTDIVDRGPFSEVYLGKQRHLSSLAAIKVPLELWRGDGDLLYKRACIQGNLTHPNIISILHYDDRDTPFLAMNVASGGSLRHILSHRQYPLEPALILSYTRQIAEALDYAHSKQVVHGNLKPENILFNDLGTLLLSDFDVLMSSPSQTSAILAPLRYTAPEQREGRIVPATDQYVLACLVYEWLSGQSPFRETEINGLKPGLATPEISESVEEVLRRALRQDPQQRYPTVKDFAMALEQAIGSKPLELQSPLLPSLPTLPTAQRVRTIALVLLFLLISSGLFVSLEIKALIQPAPAATVQSTVNPMALYASVTRHQPSFGDSTDSQNIIHWGTHTDEVGDGCKLAGDGLHLTLSKPDLVQCFPNNLNKTSDFAFQVQMTIPQGVDIEAGLLLRADPKGVAAYRFFIDTIEYISNFQAVNSDGIYASISSDGSPAIKSGLQQPNILTCIAHGNAFYLYINGTFIDDNPKIDNLYQDGSLGVFALTGGTTTIDIVFNNAKIWI